MSVVMSDIIVIQQPDDWRRLKKLVLDTVSSPITRRVYDMALDEFVTWYRAAPRPGLSKAIVNDWRASLQARRLGSSSINNRLSAIRKLATEAADNGLIAGEVAAAIGRVKGGEVSRRASRELAVATAGAGAGEYTRHDETEGPS